MGIETAVVEAAAVGRYMSGIREGFSSSSFPCVYIGDNDVCVKG